jgi:hypothetical protein
MKLTKYTQDFWVNDDSFQDISAKEELSIVVFQCEYFKGGKRKAINVRPFLKAKEEDQILASKYLGSHEKILLGNRPPINIIKASKINRSYLLLRLKERILCLENRKPSSTVGILTKFIKRYKTIQRHNKRYIFSKDYKFTKLKDSWLDVFNILTIDEWITFLSKYPPAIIYANEDIVSSWISTLSPNLAIGSEYKNLKYALPLIPESLKPQYIHKLATAAEDKFLHTLNEIKAKDYVVARAFGFDELDVARLHLASFSNRKFEDEVNHSIQEINIAYFRSELKSFPSFNASMGYRDKLIRLFSQLHEPTKYIKEVEQTLIPTIQNLIDSCSLEYIIGLLHFANKFSTTIAIHFVDSLRPSIISELQSTLCKVLTYDTSDLFINQFEPLFKYYTSLYDDEFVHQLIATFASQIKECTSFHILLYAADSSLQWLDAEVAQESAIKLINSWTLDTLDDKLRTTQKVSNIDIRVAPSIFKHAINLFSNCTTSNDTYYTETITPKGVNLLKRLLFIPKDEECNVLWNLYIDALSAKNIIIFHESSIINSLPDNIVTRVINELTISDFYNNPSNWYSSPHLKDDRIKKLLSNPDIDIFSSIANILMTECINIDDIARCVFLIELLSFNLQNLNDNFVNKLKTLRDSLPEHSLAIPILFAVYFKTSCTPDHIASIFTSLPAYLQIKIVKRFFYNIARGTFESTATKLYEFLCQSGAKSCIVVEILFSYLIQRENNPAEKFNNTNLLNIIYERNNTPDEWLHIGMFLERCQQRWYVTERLKSPPKQGFNGIIGTEKGTEKGTERNGFINFTHMVYFPQHKPKVVTDELNIYFNTIKKSIELNFRESADYTVKHCQKGDLYYVEQQHFPEWILLMEPFNIRYPYFNKTRVNPYPYRSDETPHHFCECRMSKELSRERQPFFWCSNKPCYRPAVRFHSNEEWEQYTILDFLRILQIPTDYIKQNGETIKNGYFTFLSSTLESFANFYEHMKCRKCSQLLRPVDIGNFGKQAITEFECTNASCELNGLHIYLNTCFNIKCGGIIDSRDSKRCPNGQYICPKCGQCCSHAEFTRRLSNLQKTGGHISSHLIYLINNNCGHLEKGEFYCYKCGKKLNDRKCHQCSEQKPSPQIAGNLFQEYSL